MENIYMQNLASLGDNQFLADRWADLKKNKNKNLKSIYCKKKIKVRLKEQCKELWSTKRSKFLLLWR